MKWTYIRENQKIKSEQFYKIKSYQEDKNRYNVWYTKIKINTIKSSKSNLFQIKNAFNDK
jgi:hypothetical protein